MQKKNIIRIAILTLLVLSMPLVAMQFTEQVNWDLADFVIAGILLFCSGLLFEFAVGKSKTKRSRIIIGAVIIVLFLLVWAELGVGIFGTPWAGS